MATICRYIMDAYVDLLEKKADPRVRQLPFMSSPFQVIGILLLYNYFVNKVGPQVMKSIEPFNLKFFMIFYNITQIILNSYLFCMCIKIPFMQLRYNLICEEVDYSDDPTAKFIAETVWLYFIVKILDLFDTVFMVLRKKERQITFLHVYHHTGMVSATWIATKYIAGGHAVFIGAINTLVHAIMYFYYLLTVLYPKYKKSIWWKKHLTELQMTQFVILTWHSAIAVVNPHCNFPKVLMALFFVQNLFMLAMFWDFYKKNYLSGKKKSHTENRNEYKLNKEEDNLKIT